MKILLFTDKHSIDISDDTNDDLMYSISHYIYKSEGGTC